MPPSPAPARPQPGPSLHRPQGRRGRTKPAGANSPGQREGGLAWDSQSQATRVRVGGTAPVGAQLCLSMCVGGGRERIEAQQPSQRAGCCPPKPGRGQPPQSSAPWDQGPRSFPQTADFRAGRAGGAREEFLTQLSMRNGPAPACLEGSQEPTARGSSDALAHGWHSAQIPGPGPALLQARTEPRTQETRGSNTGSIAGASPARPPSRPGGARGWAGRGEPAEEAWPCLAPAPPEPQRPSWQRRGEEGSTPSCIMGSGPPKSRRASF